MENIAREVNLDALQMRFASCARFRNEIRFAIWRFDALFGPRRCENRGIVDTDDSKRKEVDIKRYARIEKIPGGELVDSRVLRGVMVNKDVTHAGMRRKIDNPRVLLLLSAKSQKGKVRLTEMLKPNDWRRYLQIEEHIQNFLSIESLQAGSASPKRVSRIWPSSFKQQTSLRCRVRKSDNTRQRVTGATIGHHCRRI